MHEGPFEGLQVAMTLPMSGYHVALNFWSMLVGVQKHQVVARCSFRLSRVLQEVVAKTEEMFQRWCQSCATLCIVRHCKLEDFLQFCQKVSIRPFLEDPDMLCQ